MVKIDVGTLEFRVLMAVIGAIERRNPNSSSLEGVPETCRPLLATVTAVGIIGNGGFKFWYEGKRERDTMQVAEAFDRLGLTSAGDAMRRSLDAFSGRPATPEVLAHLDEDGLAAARALWAPLDQLIWRCRWEPAAARYALKHADTLATLERDSRRALAALSKAWAVAAQHLAVALDVAGDVNRNAVQHAIEANDYHAAHELLGATGPRTGREHEFWAAMRTIAEQLLVKDDGASRREHRLLEAGFVRARVEVMKVNAAGVRHLRGGPARWNLGRRPRWMGSHATELFPVGTQPAFPGSIDDAGDVRLVPACPLTVGVTIAIHRAGVLLAVGEVVEVVPARG